MYWDLEIWAPNLLLLGQLSYCHSPHCKKNCCCVFPYPEPVVFQLQSSGNPVCLELRPQCTLECHWRNASVLPVVFQWRSSDFPVVFQCVPIMQINTGSPLEQHWVQASASVVPVASQCTCGSNGLPVRSVQWYPSVLTESGLEVIGSGHYPACDP